MPLIGGVEAARLGSHARYLCRLAVLGQDVESERPRKGGIWLIMGDLREFRYPNGNCGKSMAPSTEFGNVFRTGVVLSGEPMRCGYTVVRQADSDGCLLQFAQKPLVEHGRNVAGDAPYQCCVVSDEHETGFFTEAISVS